MGAALAVAATAVTGVSAQNAHPHTPGVSGVAGGVPYLCASPTTTSTTSGAWSDARTWSNGRVPGRDDKVAIASGHTVTYGITADVDLSCIEVGGTLAFATDVDTRMRVGTIMVLENGALELGTVAQPTQADATSVIEIVDRPFLDVDPEQLGNGIVVLGRLSAHGAVKTPTFLRLAKDARAGERALELEGSVDGWRPGDRLVVPDTRQLRAGQNGRHYQPQTEVVEVESVTAASVRLTAPLRYDHSGARNGDGTTAFLPHVANLSRNVIVRSENPDGVRGHLIFVSRADVDVRYVELDELGRTKMGILDNTRIAADGRVVKIGTNQIGRYALHFHHTFGPRATPASGYQFMAVGNAINGSTKWGIVVHNSHYGLIQGNVVFNTRGGGIVTEDGTESFNVFERNFSLLTAGSRDAAPNNGYSATLPNPGGEGSAFWFRGPEQLHPQQRRRQRRRVRVRAAGHGARRCSDSAVQRRRHEPRSGNRAARYGCSGGAGVREQRSLRCAAQRRDVGLERPHRRVQGLACIRSRRVGESHAARHGRRVDCRWRRVGADER